MLQVNDLEIIKNKRIILEVPELTLESSTINALVGEEKSGKSLLTRVIHGLYPDYRGVIEFHNYDKDKCNSYLITKDVILLTKATISDNFALCSKQQYELISEYSNLAGLENDIERDITDLPYYKQKLVELVIACGVNPLILIIDDFDKYFGAQSLILAGKVLSKYKTDGGIVLLTSNLKIPEMDSTYKIENSKGLKA